MRPHLVAGGEHVAGGAHEADAHRAGVVVGVHAGRRVAHHLVLVVDLVVEDLGALALAVDLDGLRVVAQVVVADGHVRRVVAVDAVAVVAVDDVVGDDDAGGAVVGADAGAGVVATLGAGDVEALDAHVMRAVDADDIHPTVDAAVDDGSRAVGVCLVDGGVALAARTGHGEAGIRARPNHDRVAGGHAVGGLLERPPRR